MNGLTDREVTAGPVEPTTPAWLVLRERLMQTRHYVEPAWSGHEFQDWCRLWATECLRVLKPGGHLLAFGGTRTWHRLAVAIEDAGFEIRDSIAWLYGSGFPKSLDVSKAIDKAAGAERVDRNGNGDHEGTVDFGMKNRCPVCDKPYFSADPCVCPRQDRIAVTPDAVKWQGWGTALKPAFEPIVVARKSLTGTVAANVLLHGTGALNIDATRVATDESLNGGAYADNGGRAVSDSLSPSGMNRPGMTVGTGFVQPPGRWPSNVLLTHATDCVQIGTRQVKSGTASGKSRGFAADGYVGGSGSDYDGEPQTYAGPDGLETVPAWSCVPSCPVAALDAQTGTRPSGASVSGEEPSISGGQIYSERERVPFAGYGDTGGASRFFPTFRYEAKAPTTERPREGDVAHPTVKPLELMRWLVRLVTPPGGLVLDPFAGSGTTGEACVVEGFRCTLIEREPTYLPLIVARLAKPIEPVMF